MGSTVTRGHGWCDHQSKSRPMCRGDHWSGSIWFRVSPASLTLCGAPTGGYPAADSAHLLEVRQVPLALSLHQPHSLLPGTIGAEEEGYLGPIPVDGGVAGDPGRGEVLDEGVSVGVLGRDGADERGIIVVLTPWIAQTGEGSKVLGLSSGEDRFQHADGVGEVDGQAG